MGAASSARREPLPRRVRRQGWPAGPTDTGRRRDDVSRVRAESEGDADRQAAEGAEQPVMLRRSLLGCFVCGVFFVATIFVSSVAPLAQSSAPPALETLPVQGNVSVI